MHSEWMQLRQLEYFVAVVEDGQFSKAAQRLGVGQSTVSEQIRALEDDLEAELLMRASRRATPTPAGKELLSSASRILGEIDHVRRAVRGHARGELGHLRIGAIGPALSTVVPSILKHVRQVQPGIELSLATMSTEVQLASLARGELEAGFVRGAQRRPGLKVETIIDEPLCAVVPQSHKLAGRDSIRLSEIDGETFVFWPRSANAVFYDQIISVCHRHDCTPERMIESTDMQTQLALIGAGVGVSVQPISFREPNRDDLQFIPLSGAVGTVALQMAWSPAWETPAIRSLLHAARRVKSSKVKYR